MSDGHDCEFCADGFHVRCDACGASTTGSGECEACGGWVCEMEAFERVHEGDRPLLRDYPVSTKGDR